MPPTNYLTGQPMHLFDAILAQLGDDPKQLHPGVLIGFPSDNHVTVSLINARYCESDGRAEATELGDGATFFRADAGIVLIERQELVLESKLITLSNAWNGPQTTKRGVIVNPQNALCKPDSLTRGATQGQAGGSIKQTA